AAQSAVSPGGDVPNLFTEMDVADRVRQSKERKPCKRGTATPTGFGRYGVCSSAIHSASKASTELDEVCTLNRRNSHVGGPNHPLPDRLFAALGVRVRSSLFALPGLRRSAARPARRSAAAALRR